MIEWVLSTVPLFKALHITALVLWCGGLIALPVMMSYHEPSVSQREYAFIRRGTHLVYTSVVTPCAVVAVIAGTWLAFMRETFTPWFFVKLAMVALLLALHVWIGHGIVQIAEEPGTHRPVRAQLPVAGVVLVATAILFLVLAKPDLGWIAFPDWSRSPLGGQLPFEVPNR